MKKMSIAPMLMLMMLLLSAGLIGCASTEPADELAAAAPVAKNKANNADIRTGSRIPGGNNSQPVAATTGKTYMEGLDGKSVQTDFH